MINKKLIHFNTYSAFEANKSLLYDWTIAFIGETKQIYTHGNFYDCNIDDINTLLDAIDAINTALESKLDIISDLDTIRSGAELGATALQSYTETDPVFSASAAASIKSSDITNWNNKTSNTGTITGVSANGTSVATSGVANIPAASTSAYGVTKLSSSTSSTSTTLAATASAVKSAYDLANGKISGNGTITNIVKVSSLPSSPNANTLYVIV